MLNQERLNILIEEDFVFSANVITKVLIEKLKIKRDGIDDWLRTLNLNDLNDFLQYCNLCLFEFTENDNEDEVIDVRDLICLIHVLLEMETGNFHDLTEENLIECIQIVAIAANLEFLRKAGLIKVFKKGFLSRKDVGYYEDLDPEDKNIP